MVWIVSWARFAAGIALAVLAGAGAAIPATASAQASATLEGKITESASGAPAADVLIRIDGTTRTAVSGPDGRYRLSGLRPGTYAVIVQRIGYAARRDTVALDGAGLTHDITLAVRATLVEPVVVSGTREVQQRAEASASISVLDGAEIRRTRAGHPAEVMNRIAGVHVVALSGEGHMMAIRQPMTTNPMYLYLEDGVPTRATGFFNHNALYEVNIPQSGGLEVLKGPGTALYGSDAIGGVVNVLTRPAPATPEGDLSVEGGGFGYARVLAGGGFTSGANGFRGDVNVMRSDTWKVDAPFSRQSATLRWESSALNRWLVRTVVTGSNISQQDTPTLSQAQFDATPSLNRAPIAYRRVKALRLTSAFERESARSLWTFTPYARYDVLDLLPSWQLSFDPQVWSTKNSSVGLLAKYRRDFTPMQARVIAGADVDFSPGSFKADQITTTPTGGVWSSYAIGDPHYDYDVTYSSASPYVQAELTPWAGVRFDAGLRYDRPAYDYTTHLAPLATGAHRRPENTSVSYGHLSPKFGVTWAATNAVSLFGSYRHGFRAPSQGQLFQQNSAANTVDLRPVRVDSWEVGFRGRAGPRVLFDVAGYDMTIRNDIITFITPQNTRQATNAGATRHRGIETALHALITPSLRADISWTSTDQRYVTWNPSATVNYSGNLRDGAPRSLGDLLLGWSPTALRGGRVAVEWSHTGSYAQDPANTVTYGGYELINVFANTFVQPHVEVFARVVNAGDRRYGELVTYDAFQKSQYNPGAPRTVVAGVKWGWSSR